MERAAAAPHDFSISKCPPNCVVSKVLSPIEPYEDELDGRLGLGRGRVVCGNCVVRGGHDCVPVLMAVR